jgi:hypothetical protein
MRKAAILALLTFVCGTARADDTAPTKEQKPAAGATVEQSLIAALPPLLWSRAKLEFMFEKRAELSTSLAKGADSDAEAGKMAAQMASLFSSPAERKLFTEGWKMVGKVHSDTVNFSKPGCSLAGATGRIELLFDRERLVSLSFWADTDLDLTKLNSAIVHAVGSAGTLTVKGKDASELKWEVSGSNHYEIILERDSSDPTETVRGLTIFIKHPSL